MLQLERWSYYQHLSLTGGQERPICCCRVLDIRGSRYHVVTRIQDAGLDFTGRTNFLAHHLVLAPEEVRSFKLPSPPVILRDWSGWMRSWPREAQLLDSEDWSALAGLSASASVPANTWRQLTGDAVNGYGLLEARAGIAFRVDDLTEEQILSLFSESLEMLDLRDARRDFRATSWQYTFTTSMQEQDNPADFRWRCLHADNPASSRFAGQDCRSLIEVRAQKISGEEAVFARSGRAAPQFVTQPQNVQIHEGETARLYAKAEGVPTPTYQWFKVDRANNGEIIAGSVDAELVLPNPPFGKSRYVVQASNTLGAMTSEVVTLSVDPKPHLRPREISQPRQCPNTGEEFEKLNRTYDESEAKAPATVSRVSIRLLIAVLLALMVAAVILWRITWADRETQSQASRNTSQEQADVQATATPSRFSLQIAPAEETLSFGEPLELRVQMENASGYSFKWYRNGAAIPGVTNTTYNVTNSAEGEERHEFFVIATKGHSIHTSRVAAVEYRPKKLPFGDPEMTATNQ